MDIRFVIGSTFTLSLLLMTGPAQAVGWDDLLKSLEEAAPQLLESSDDEVSQSLDKDTLVRGLKEALSVGTQRTVDLVSQTDGYYANPRIKIPLPASLQQGTLLLRQVGMESLADDFELSMNRAAEKAAPQATQFFMDALSKMTIDDARRVYEGGDDAATRYFQEHTGSQIENAFKPVIKDAIEQVGATRYYQALVGEVSQYPLVGSLDLDLEDYVSQQAVSGLFQMLAEEEKRIREEPVARSTELLKQVFGS